MRIFNFDKWWILLICILPMFLHAKTPKPRILIYGSTLEAYVAALQSAASGVPTLWVNPQAYSFEEDKVSLEKNTFSNVLDGGPIQNFDAVRSVEKDSVLVSNVNRKNSTSNLLTQNNSLLTILSLKDVVKIERGKSWKIVLSDKKNYEVISVVDASENSDLLKKTKLENLPQLKFRRANEIELEESRAVVFVGEFQDNVYISMLSDLCTQKDNFYAVNVDAYQSKSFRISYAQAMGAIAGYCAFFKTTADKIDLRTLQNELLMHGSRLLPTVDVSVKDANFMSLQRVYLTGVLPLKFDDNGKPIFVLDDSVRVSDIKSIVNRFYSRAQLWFVDNNPEYLTVQDALNLIKFTAFRAEELDVEVKSKWNKELTFKGNYDPSKVISRYEFAVLLDKYAIPFVKKVSQNGLTINR